MSRQNLEIGEVEKLPEECYYCHVCGEQYSWDWQLQQHMKTHHNISMQQNQQSSSTCVKTYNCSYCDYKTYQKCNLVVHERTHTGEKPYKCNMCDYRGTTASTLVRHHRIHTGEKPYKCSLCEYRAANTASLKYHMLHRHRQEAIFSNKIN